MALLVLLFIFLSGMLPLLLLKKEIKSLNAYAYLFIFGSAVSIPFLYLTTAFVTHKLSSSILIWIFVVVMGLFLLFRYVKFNFSLRSLLIFLFLTLWAFSFFQRSFNYTNETFYIDSNLYSDLGLHLSTIRSFSIGNNFPFELPYFSGEKISYHFFYDLFTGILEFGGMRIDVAYNLIFSLTLASIFFIFLDFGKKVFGKIWIGCIAFFLFILSPDLSFLATFFDSKHNLLTLWNMNSYYLDSFLGSHTVGNFLYFNTYLNQRHLFFSLALSLAIFMPVWKILNNSLNPKISMFTVGFLIGLMPYWNFPVFVCTAFVTGLLFIFFRKFKNLLYIFLTVSVLVIPQIFSLQGGLKDQIELKPGFLVHSNFSYINLISFWFLNLGVATVTILGGIVISEKNKRILFFALLPIFIIPNIFKLGVDMFHNAKFFNFWYMYISFFSATFIIFLLSKAKLYKLIAITLLIFSILSGVLGFIVIKNAVKTTIPDYSQYKLIKYVYQKVPKNEIIVTNGEIYDPLSISGRNTYLGRTNDVFWFGANPDKRSKIVNSLLVPQEKDIIMKARRENIRYIIIYKDNSVKNLKTADTDKLKQLFNKLYEDNFGIIFKVY